MVGHTARRREGRGYGLMGGLVAVLIVFWAAQAWAAQVQKVVSTGGVEAWLVEEPSIPFVTMSYAFRGGARTDPADKAGLAELVAGLLNEGAGPYDSLAFQKRLDELAIEMTFNASRDVFGGGLRTLTEHRDEAFALLALALTAPHFESEAVERVRSQSLTALARRDTDPNQVARKLWAATAFPDHPYGQPVSGTAETVAAIEVSDLKRFVAERFARDKLVIGVAGDISAAELGPLLDSTFGGLPTQASATEIGPVHIANTGRTIVENMNVPQSVVVFGMPGLSRDHPDFYTAYVMNHILGGGGFGSRLTEEVREKRGLAYGIYSYLMPLDYTALHVGSVATENQRVGESLDVVRAELARLRDHGVTEKELADAKTYLTGSFPLRLDSNQEVANILVTMQLQDLGIDYIERRNALMEAVTREDIARVARDIVDPESLMVVVVGNPEGVEASAVN